MYHVTVLMLEKGISADDVLAEFSSRHVIDHKVKQEKRPGSQERCRKIAAAFFIVHLFSLSTRSGIPNDPFFPQASLPARPVPSEGSAT